MPHLMHDVPEAKVAGQRRLLSCDGGGVRGVLTLEVLVELERRLRVQYESDELVLADYFDYFAGTSTGSMIAAGLALGLSAEELLDLYTSRLIHLIEPIPVWKWIAQAFRYRYPSAEITQEIKKAYGEDTLFGDARMRSLLMCALHNSTTDSAWPLSNNPRALYNDPTATDCNNRIPLWRVVRASGAAPLAYPPERVDLDGRSFVFVDGALTPYNNPAYQLFVMATAPEYRLNWETGVDKLLLVSVGTGLSPNERPGLETDDTGLLHHATTLLSSLLSGASIQQDMACRTIGHCLHGHELDSELGEMRALSDPSTKLFSYIRYNATFTVAGMNTLGLDHLTDNETLKALRSILASENVPLLREVGRRVATQVNLEHYAGFSGVAPAR